MRYIIPFVAFVFMIGGTIFLATYNKSTKPSPITIGAPSPTPQLNVPIKTEVNSPDGLVKAILTSQKQENGTITYTVMAEKITGEDQKYIFSKTGNAQIAIVLPQNAWSPDNKYLFILEKNKDIITALVFKASGEAFANGAEYLDVTPMFLEKNKTLEIANITGWASPSLLYVQTKTESLTKGPTFWFDIDSKNFLLLAS